MSDKKEDDFEKGLREILSAGQPAKRDREITPHGINNNNTPIKEKKSSETALKIISVVRVVAAFALLFFLLVFVNNIVNF